MRAERFIVNFITVVLAGLAILIFAQRARAQELRLEEYLSQVRGSHSGLKGAKESAQGSEATVNAGDLQFRPQLVLEAAHIEDEYKYYNTQMSGTLSKRDSYTASVLQQTPFGLTAKFSYEFLRSDVEGSNSNFQAPTEYKVTPSLELTLPLWRNGLGSEFRSNRDAANASNRKNFYSSRLTFDKIVLGAEQAYAGLYFARQVTAARRESLDVAKKLLEWMRRRAANRLADDNDFNQAQAAYEQGELELLRAENDERRAARALNSLRGIESDVVEEKLTYTVQTVDVSKRATNLMNDEVRLAQQDLMLARASLQSAREGVRPVFDVFAKFSQNGLDAVREDAMSQAEKRDYPYQMVGARFQVPIMFWESAKVSEGLRRSVVGAELQLKRLEEDNRRNLSDLYANIESSQRLMTLSQKLVQTQKKKLEKERQRHRLGRSTLYQVLQYEQEYVASQLQQIGYQSELVSLTNQLRLYRGEQ